MSYSSAHVIRSPALLSVWCNCYSVPLCTLSYTTVRCSASERYKLCIMQIRFVLCLCLRGETPPLHRGVAYDLPRSASRIVSNMTWSAVGYHPSATCFNIYADLNTAAVLQRAMMRLSVRCPFVGRYLHVAKLIRIERHFFQKIKFALPLDNSPRRGGKSSASAQVKPESAPD